MYKNYFKVALRILRKQKVYSYINIAGLAIGMACCLLILLWVQDELSYDRFHEKAGEIYRLAQIEKRNSGEANYPLVFPVMAPKLRDEYPEVLNFVRFDRSQRVLVSTQEKKFIEERFFYADPSVFEMFNFHLAFGDPKSVLQAPYSVVLTEETAEKYFGKQNAVGKTLTVDNSKDYMISGVLKNIPHNSHLKFDFLASLSTLEAENPRYGKLWAWSCYTYLLLPKGYQPQELEKKFPDFVLRHRNPGAAKMWNFYLQPLTKIHLHSNLAYEIEPNGDIRYVYIFSAVALFIMLIACINFMNLVTARSANRAKEVGVRKVLGADRFQLTKQFLAESVLLSVIALPISVVLVDLLLPGFNALSAKDIGLSHFAQSAVFLGAIGLLVFVGIISGSYPAFFLSAFRPGEVLRGKLRAGLKGSSLRKVLVVVQFSISIVLVVGTVVIYRQLDFIRNKKLGFDKENVIVMPVKEEIQERYESFKNALRQSPLVTDAAGSTSIPGYNPTISAFVPEGREDDKPFVARNMLVDYDFIKTFGMEIKEGRDFSRDFITDAEEAFIINETAAKEFGWEKAVGKKLKDLDTGSGTVVGVVRDFHFRSKHQRIEPLILSLLPAERFVYFVSVKAGGANAREILSFLKDKWREFSPNRPFEYFFLDENLHMLYRAEERLGKIFSVFSFLAIFIACLGLFGLASFTAEQRTKEIGIRKVLGASVSNIIFLLSKEFTRWVIVANLIAWPVAYFAMRRWLESFAYRVSITPWVFLLAAFLALVIAFLTVSFQAVKAAVANPVDCIRYE